MQMFVFFLAMFSSASWLIYALLFMRSKLAAEGLWEQSPELMLTMLAVIFLPVLTIWLIFGYINQYINNKQMNRKQSELLMQLQKNQDYTDLVVRVMLDAEHEIKDGFVINKFEVLINDMNEALSEIIQRCNLASSAQLEQLWQRVGRGERWTLGKVILEAGKSRSTFDSWVREKAGRDKVFRGSLLEFCSRYQNLLQLLEKHDRDRVFLRMIEMGVLGKVYSIIAPLSSGIDTLSATKDEHYTPSAAAPAENDYASVLKLATMAEPTAQNTIMNVDKDDRDDEDDDDQDEEYEEKSSIFSRFKLFGRKKEPEQMPSMADQDPFFRALHNSFQSEPNMSTNEPSFASEPRLSNIPSFGADKTATEQETPENFKLSTTENEDSSKETLSAMTGLSDFAARLAAVRSEASSQTAAPTPSVYPAAENPVSTPEISAPQLKVPEAVKDDDDENEDLVYPFGGWGNEVVNDK